MADPFSVITGVLGILSSVIATSKAVIEIVSDVGEASKEIRCLSKDCHAFFSIVRSLDIALREQDVQDIVESDAAILDMISNLADPLRNCRAVLTDLMVKMRKHTKSSEGKGSGINFGSLKWAVLAKGEIKDIQLHLETTKSTLNSALDAVQLYVQV
jgi:Fungal N-terminal domain of STAND proteins